MAAIRCSECGQWTSSLCGVCYFCDSPRRRPAEFDSLVARLLCCETLAAASGALAVRLAPLAGPRETWVYALWTVALAALFAGLVVSPWRGMVRQARRLPRPRRLPRTRPVDGFWEEHSWACVNVDSVGD